MIKSQALWIELDDDPAEPVVKLRARSFDESGRPKQLYEIEATRQDWSWPVALRALAEMLERDGR